MTTAMPSPPARSADLSPGWSLALGVLLIAAGILALLYPVVAAVTAALYVGWFAIFAGAVAISIAIKTRAEVHFGWRLAVGILYVLLGLMLIANPIAGAASLALLVGALMACSGVVEIMLAVRLKPRGGWGWLLANGIVSITQRGLPFRSRILGIGALGMGGWLLKLSRDLAAERTP